MIAGFLSFTAALFILFKVNPQSQVFTKTEGFGEFLIKNFKKFDK